MTHLLMLTPLLGTVFVATILASLGLGVVLAIRDRIAARAPAGLRRSRR